MRSKAGATTGWLKSEVDQSRPMRRKRMSSEARGHAEGEGWARARARLFCMRASLLIQCAAAGWVCALHRLTTCGSSPLITPDTELSAGTGEVVT